MQKLTLHRGYLCTRFLSFYKIISMFSCIFSSRLWKTFLRNTLYIITETCNPHISGCFSLRFALIVNEDLNPANQSEANICSLFSEDQSNCCKSQSWHIERKCEATLWVHPCISLKGSVRVYPSLGPFDGPINHW